MNYVSLLDTLEFDILTLVPFTRCTGCWNEVLHCCEGGLGGKCESPRHAEKRNMLAWTAEYGYKDNGYAYLICGAWILFDWAALGFIAIFEVFSRRFEGLF